MTPDGVGGHVAARDEAAAAGLVSTARQRALWARVMRARYAAITVTGLICLVPATGEHHWYVAAFVLAIGLPHNALYDHVLRRRGALHVSMAFADQVLVVAFMAAMPTWFASATLYLLAITGLNVVAFGRRVAALAFAVAFIGVSLVVAVEAPPDAVAPLAVLGVASVFTLVVVGAMSDDEEDLRHRYRELTENIDAVLWELRADSPSTLYVSDEVTRLLGYPAAECRDPARWSGLVHPDDWPVIGQRYREAASSRGTHELEYRLMAVDGRTVWVQDRVRVTHGPDGDWQRLAGVLVDVTAMKEAERQVNQFVNLVDTIDLALLVVGLDDPGDPDDSLRVLAINPEAARLASLSPPDAVGKKVVDVLALTEVPLTVERLASVIRTGVGYEVDEYRVSLGALAPRVYSVFVFPLPDHAVAVALHDITERTLAAEVLRRQALHDGLTGLPNRTLLNERVRNALKRGRRSGTPVSLLVMDLDQFKDVNDALGHDQGDKLLIEVSRRLQAVVREADTIARLGGDEFAVLLTDGVNETRARAVANRIREALEEPFQLEGITLQTAASVGVAVSPVHGDDAETLAQRADVAMYQAKRSGTGAELYAAEHDQSSVRRLALLGELRSAISEDDLRLHYQPCLDLATGAVRSAEALVRWQHSEHGLLPPSEFIDLAEVSGLIRPLTRWVIENALEQIRGWRDHGVDLTVAVNLSVKDLYDRDLVGWLDDRLDAWGLEARCLKLEITESQLMDDPLLALEVLGRLKALGTATSVDDFGTGYSSLAYLKHLPIDELKIDKSFVGNLVHDPNDLVIVRSTIDLSHNLGLAVVAEGVEDGATLVRLAELACDRAQGYYVSPPLPGEEMVEWMQGHHDELSDLDLPPFRRSPPSGPDSSGTPGRRVDAHAEGAGRWHD